MVGLLAAVGEGHELQEQVPKDCSPVYSEDNGSLMLLRTREHYAQECAMVIHRADLTVTDDNGKDYADWFGIMRVLSNEFEKAEKAEKAGGVS